MQVKNKRLVLITLLAGLVLCCAMPAQAAKNFNNISFMGSYVERHPTPVRAFMPFFAAAKEAFPGRLSFNYFSAGTLYPEKEGMAAISDGRGDIGVVTPSMFPGSLSLANVVDIPGLAPNSVIGALVLQDLVEKFPEVTAEYPPNTVPFTVWASAAYQLHCNKPINTIEQIKGMKIIVWNSTGIESVKLLGGNPIRLEARDSYLALSKGMADAIYCPTAPIRSFKISESMKHHFIINMGVGAFTMFMNKDLYDSMPADIKAWIKENSGRKLALACGKSLLDGEIDDIKWMKEQGDHYFYYPTEAERQVFVERVKPFEEKWVNDCLSQGITVAPEVLKYAKERSAYHLDQMRKGAYGKYENI